MAQCGIAGSKPLQWIRVCERFVERDLLLVDPDLVLRGI